MGVSCASGGRRKHFGLSIPLVLEGRFLGGGHDRKRVRPALFLGLAGRVPALPRRTFYLFRPLEAISSPQACGLGIRGALKPPRPAPTHIQPLPGSRAANPPQLDPRRARRAVFPPMGPCDQPRALDWSEQRSKCNASHAPHRSGGTKGALAAPQTHHQLAPSASKPARTTQQHHCHLPVALEPPPSPHTGTTFHVAMPIRLVTWLERAEARENEIH